MHKSTQRCLSTSENSLETLARRCKDNDYNRWVFSEGHLINIGKDSCFIGINNDAKIGFTRPIKECSGEKYKIWNIDANNPWEDVFNIRHVPSGHIIKVDIDGLFI